MDPNTTITITINRATELPSDVHGAVAGSGGAYTIMLNANDTPARQLAAFLHDAVHIYNGDLENGGDAAEIETRTRRQLLEALEIIREEAEQ